MSFTWPARVYWEDTDGGGIVYYANYLRFLERARTEWLRSLGYSQQRLAQDPGIVFTVVSLNIDYRKPARLDDELVVTCVPSAEGAVTLRFAQQIYRKGADGNTLLVEASVRVACVDAATLRPCRLPDFLSAEALAPQASTPGVASNG
ncbi:MAG TPA: tol-pal system-associated acyl-CoA thioesterase [Steroidobacteraceae bacterium]